MTAAALVWSCLLGGCIVYDESLLSTTAITGNGATIRDATSEVPSDATFEPDATRRWDHDALDASAPEGAVAADASNDDARPSGGGGDASDSGAGVRDDAAGAGEAAVPAPCAGRAIRFDGSPSHADVKSYPADDFTIEAWIKTTSSRPGNAAYQGLGLFYADVGGTANDFAVAITNQQIAFVVGNPDSTLFSNAVVTTGKWTHIAMTREKATAYLAIYVNGNVDKTLVDTNTASLSAAKVLTIGANTVSGTYYVGDLDELRLWAVVRTRDEILDTMHRRLAGNEAGLKQYYRFDQTGGNTVSDLSTTQPSKNDAVITGTALFVASDAPISCP